MRRRLIKSEFERHSSPLGMAIKQAMITSIQTIERAASIGCRCAFSNLQSCRGY
jgi:hypothetical protein